MKILTFIIAILFVGLFMTSCQQKEQAEVIPVPAEDAAEIAAKVAAFAPTTINTDISYLSERQQKVIEYLVEAANMPTKFSGCNLHQTV
jgi:outer membrane lipoprotein-sorting protein